MKEQRTQLFIITFMMMIATVTISHGQQAANYKHPYLNSSGQVVDEKENVVGFVSKDGTIKNGAGEVVGYIKGTNVTEASGKKIGYIGKNGAFYDDKDAIVFTIDPKDKGERCKIYDPQGKVIAEVHESYKNEACAIHCLFKMKEMKH